MICIRIILNLRDFPPSLYTRTATIPNILPVAPPPHSNPYHPLNSENLKTITMPLCSSIFATKKQLPFCTLEPVVAQTEIVKERENWSMLPVGRVVETLLNMEALH